VQINADLQNNLANSAPILQPYDKIYTND
jgi:hypothetical protein